jgi:hypothetical protein
MVWPLGMAFWTTLLSQLMRALIAVSYQPIHEDYWTGRRSKYDLEVTGRRATGPFSQGSVKRAARSGWKRRFGRPPQVTHRRVEGAAFIKIPNRRRKDIGARDSSVPYF